MDANGRDPPDLLEDCGIDGEILQCLRVNFNRDTNGTQYVHPAWGLRLRGVHVRKAQHTCVIQKVHVDAA